MTSNQPWWLTWPVAEVAAVILPLFSSSASQPHMNARVCIVNWCKTGSYKSTAVGILADAFKDPDHRAIVEAMQVLEYAGLLMTDDRFYVGLSRLGWHALQTNTVREHLGLSDAPPTA